MNIPDNPGNSSNVGKCYCCSVFVTDSPAFLWETKVSGEFFATSTGEQDRPMIICKSAFHRLLPSRPLSTSTPVTMKKSPDNFNLKFQ